MKEFRSKYYLVDIDGTITGYRPGSMAPEKLVGGNFLFPIFRDLMVERGWDKLEAEARIVQLARDVVFWDYSDFMVEFELPVAETFRRMRTWHHENLFTYGKTVELLRQLHRDGRKLFVMSNNPHLGCLMKLEAAGLADAFSAPCFTRVFGHPTCCAAARTTPRFGNGRSPRSPPPFPRSASSATTLRRTASCRARSASANAS